MKQNLRDHNFSVQLNRFFFSFFKLLLLFLIMVIHKMIRFSSCTVQVVNIEVRSSPTELRLSLWVRFYLNADTELWMKHKEEEVNDVMQVFGKQQQKSELKQEVEKTLMFKWKLLRYSKETRGNNKNKLILFVLSCMFFPVLIFQHFFTVCSKLLFKLHLRVKKTQFFSIKG